MQTTYSVNESLLVLKVMVIYLYLVFQGFVCFVLIGGSEIIFLELVFSGFVCFVLIGGPYIR